MKEAAFSKGLLKLLPSVFDIYGRKKDLRLVDDATKRIDLVEDHKLLSDIDQDSLDRTKDKFEYTEGPMESRAPILINGRLVPPRSPQTAYNALVHAQFKCEINPDHPTFIRKRDNRPYTEPHHLVPMAYQDQLDGILLDREQNIVSLCSNCHNEIHYGRDAKKLVEKLYKDRQNLLESIGVELSLEQLLEIYE